MRKGDARSAEERKQASPLQWSSRKKSTLKVLPIYSCVSFFSRADVLVGLIG